MKYLRPAPLHSHNIYRMIQNKRKKIHPNQHAARSKSNHPHIHPMIQKQKRRYDPSASASQDEARQIQSKSTREIKSLRIRRIRRLQPLRRLHSKPHYNSWRSHSCSPTSLHPHKIYTPRFKNKKESMIHPRQHRSESVSNTKLTSCFIPFPQCLTHDSKTKKKVWSIRVSTAAKSVSNTKLTGCSIPSAHIHPMIQ